MARHRSGFAQHATSFTPSSFTAPSRTHKSLPGSQASSIPRTRLRFRFFPGPFSQHPLATHHPRQTPCTHRRQPRTIPSCPLIDDIRAYRPFNQQEAADRAVILRQLEADPQVFDRSSLAHMTCSIWTVDPTAAKTLMVYHNVYRSWSWIGGHADGERDLARRGAAGACRGDGRRQRADHAVRAGRHLLARSADGGTGMRNAGATWARTCT